MHGKHAQLELSRPRHADRSSRPLAQPLSGRRSQLVIGAVAAVALAVGGGLLTLDSVDASATGTATADTAAYAAAVNVSDVFNRTVSNGLGAANEGGAYTITTGAPSRFSVSGAAAHIGPVAPGTVDTATLGAVRAGDEQVRAEVSVASLPTSGNGPYLSLQLRRQATGVTQYLARARVLPGGRVLVSLLRVVNGKQTVLSDLEYASGLTAQAGRPFYLEGRVTRAENPTLSVRAYALGVPAPAWASVQVDTAPGPLSSPGSVGIELYVSGSSPASTISLGSLTGWALTPATAPPGTPSPSASSSSAVPSKPATSPASSLPPATPSSGVSTAPSTSSSSPTSPPSTVTAAPPAAVGGGAAGASPLGTASYAIPAGAIFAGPTGNDTSGKGTSAAPYASVTRAVAAAPAGGTVVLRGGSYNEYVTLKKAVTIQNYPGEVVWMDGSIPVSGWTKSGSGWVHSGWNYQFDSSASFTKGANSAAFLDPSSPLAAHPDQVLLDGTLLTQVAANPGPGQFAVNYSARTITVGSDPDGHAVRASNLQQAFLASAGSVNLRGIGVRRYATSVWQMGTVFLGGAAGRDLIQNVVFTQNATQGISVATSNVTLDHVSATDNGMTGIHANTANGLVVQNSLLQGNNTQRFNPATAASALKATNTKGVTLRNNLVTGNVGTNGLWLDVTVSDFTIVGNRVTNAGAPYGILAELSDTGVIADNVQSGAKYGITAFNTGNVQIFNNELSNNSIWDVGLTQDARRNTNSATSGAVPWLVRNVVVANNIFGSAGTFQFYVLDKQTKIAASSMNITVNGNQFPQRAGSSQPVMVGWGGANNVIAASYRSPAELNAGLGRSWTNTQPAAGAATAAAKSGQASIAVPLPAAVAQAVGQPTGTKHVGTFG